MPIRMRAKQFAMFDALKGLREAITGKEQQYCTKIEIAEDKIDEINSTISFLRKGDNVTIKYYCEYSKNYKMISGEIEKLDIFWKSIQVGNIAISFTEITDIYC